eukprot:362713-Chlamydomonas_euryale.AAC.13
MRAVQGAQLCYRWSQGEMHLVGRWEHGAARGKWPRDRGADSGGAQTVGGQMPPRSRCCQAKRSRVRRQREGSTLPHPQVLRLCEGMEHNPTPAPPAAKRLREAMERSPTRNIPVDTPPPRRLVQTHTGRRP